MIKSTSRRIAKSNAKKTADVNATVNTKPIAAPKPVKNAELMGTNPTEPTAPRTTKQELVLTLLSRNGGAGIDEIMRATGWQQHSVRGFFAGTVRKKLGFDLTSEKAEGSERRYAIKVAA
jgi:hypothetical protein